MTPSEGTYHQLQHHTRIIERLENACKWAGIPNGRARQYSGLILEFWQTGPRTREHVLAHNEAFEILDLYESWQGPVDQFEGLKPKIAATMRGGPILREGENPSVSSNKARNDAFVYYVAGELLQAGIDVRAVEGCRRDGASCHIEADITIQFTGRLIDVQCKRPQSHSAAKGLI